MRTRCFRKARILKNRFKNITITKYRIFFFNCKGNYQMDAFKLAEKAERHSQSLKKNEVTIKKKILYIYR